MRTFNDDNFPDVNTKATLAFMESSPNFIQGQLKKNGFAYIPGKEMFIPAQLYHSWKEFVDSYSNLPQDPYINGKFRFRRMSKYEVYPNEGKVIHRPDLNEFSQVSQRAGERVNVVAGDKVRVFPPIEDAENLFLHSMILVDAENLPLSEEEKERGLLADVHQFMVVTSDREVGSSTPEGIHLDDQFANCIHLIKKRHASGGVNNFYDEHKHHVASIELRGHMDTIFIRDIYHDVSLLYPSEFNIDGFRQTLIIGFDLLK